MAAALVDGLRDASDRQVPGESGDCVCGRCRESAGGTGTARRRRGKGFANGSLSSPPLPRLPARGVSESSQEGKSWKFANYSTLQQRGGFGVRGQVRIVL